MSVDKRREGWGLRGGHRADERGLVIIYLTMCLTVLMVTSAFVVDLGSWYTRAAHLQRAADAAALGGVTFMPGDFNQARSTALAIAAKNGFDPSTNPNITVDVMPDPSASYRLNVTITDSAVKRYFSQTFDNSAMQLSRHAVAEYLPPIPLGSPENAFGLGSFGTDTYAPNDWAAVAGWCTPKESGDRYMTRYDAEYMSGTWQCGGSGTVDNDEYDGLGVHAYTYNVDVPTNRVSSLIIEAYDPAYVPHWFAGTSMKKCDGTTGTAKVNEGSHDAVYNLAGNIYDITTHFDVYGPTGALLQTNSFASQEDGMFGTVHGDAADCGIWRALASLGVTAAAGNYKVKVWTDAGEANSFGVNTFSLEARYATEASATRCSTVPGAPSSPAPYSATCAGVSADSAMTAYTEVDGSGSTKISKFYLAPISSAYAGKTVTIKLWDPGDLQGSNTNKLQVLDPSGAAMAFDWSTDGPCGMAPACSGSVGTAGLVTSGATNQPPNNNLQGTTLFNDRLVTITIAVPAGYTVPAGTGGWWKLNYTYNGGTPSRDLTTWAVSVEGGPVHLVNG